EELAAATHLSFTDNLDDIADCTVFIATVPTPIDEFKAPDLTPLIKASESLGKVLKAGDIVIYESTVYPGATEEVCVPVPERVSGINDDRDVEAGAGRDGIHAGVWEHRVTMYMKETYGAARAMAVEVDALYAEVRTAGTHQASSIMVA